VIALALTFYALNAPRLPLYASLLAVGCNIVANLALSGPLEAPGLALGTSLGALANFTFLLVVFARRYGGLSGHGIAGQIGRVLVASAAMGLLCRFAWRGLVAIWPDGIPGHAFVVTLVPVGLGVAAYFAFAALMRVEEVTQGRRLLNRALRRR